MHRTFRRNLRQPPPLSLRKISNHDKFFLNTIDQFGLFTGCITIFRRYRGICESTTTTLVIDLFSFDLRLKI
jgi:hypothetical protein